ncbi:winged helix-turn-helix domain-containing protein [Bacillus tianshenii]|nr:winged helix-turn-helix domain-containing protein [Bacillus tianshenii]
METKEVKLPEQGRIAYHLLALMYREGRIDLSVVYSKLEEKMGITEEQKNLKYDSGESMWKARVRAAKHNTLKETGLVRNGKKGVWEITSKGKKKFEEMQKLGLISLNY